MEAATDLHGAAEADADVPGAAFAGVHAGDAVTGLADAGDEFVLFRVGLGQAVSFGGRGDWVLTLNLTWIVQILPHQCGV